MLTFLDVIDRVKGLLLAFAFLATASPITAYYLNVMPCQDGVVFWTIVAEAAAIVGSYLFLGTASQAALRLWGIRFGVVTGLCLLIYCGLESAFVYTTPPPTSERRVRGFEYVSDLTAKFVSEAGSINEALRQNEWKSDGIYTERSRVVVSLSMLVAWLVGFYSAFGALTLLALHEGKKRGASKGKKPATASKAPSGE